MDIKESLYVANKFIKLLKKYNKQIKKITIVGSIRRKMPVNNDIDLLTTTKLDELIIDNITQIKKIITQGEKRKSIIFEYTYIHKLKKVQIDLFYSDIQCWPFALLHHTGGKLQNIKMRKKANKLGYKLNQYGLFPIDNNHPELDLKKFKTEKDIFKFLDKAYKSPSKRA